MRVYFRIPEVSRATRTGCRVVIGGAILFCGLWGGTGWAQATQQQATQQPAAKSSAAAQAAQPAQPTQPAQPKPGSQAAAQAAQPAHSAQLAQPAQPAQPKSGSQAAAAPSAIPGAAAGAVALSPAAASRKAWQCLKDGLAEKNYDRRAQAITALGAIGLRPDVVSLIEASLNDKDAPVRLAAVEVLGKMKSRSSIPKLQAALDDPSAVVAFAAAKALWAIGDHSGEGLFLEVMSGDRKASTSMIRGGMQQAHEELHDPTALAELGAEQTAGAFFGPAGFGLTTAIELTKDKAAPARAASALLLADDKSDDAREALRDALEDKSWIVRGAAAEAIGAHGSANDVATLAPLLNDPHKEVRYRAAAAILRVIPRRAA